MLADNNQMRSFSMGPPLKGVYNQIIKTNNFGPDLPTIDEQSQKRGFIGHAKIPNISSNQFVSELDDSQFTLTGRVDPEQHIKLHSPVAKEDELLNTAKTAVPNKTKVSNGRAGGFKISVKEDKTQNK